MNTELAPITKIENAVMARANEFAQLVGGSSAMGNRFARSVMILVASADPNDNYSLLKCSPDSIVSAAMRAANQHVSLDPSDRQAYLVPRWNNKRKTIEAVFQLHYSEVRARAWRTNRYLIINVAPVYEGETVYENVYSGLHQVQLKSGLMTVPGQQNGFVPVNERRGKVIGRLGYLKFKNGGEITVYMTTQDIIQQVEKGNQSWAKSTAWLNHRDTMESKTVLLALLRKADTSPDEMAKFTGEQDGGEIPEDAAVDGIVTDGHDELPAVSAEPAEPVTVTKPTEEENLSLLGFGEPEPEPKPLKLTPRPSALDGLANPKALVDAGICESIAQAVTALNATKMAGKPMTEAEPVLREYMKAKAA